MMRRAAFITILFSLTLLVPPMKARGVEEAITNKQDKTVAPAPSSEPSFSPSTALWYRQPAERWIEALPVGNGRLGAMIHGKVDNERIQLNEDSLWAGRPDNRFNKGTAERIREIRKLLWQGKTKEAEKDLMNEFSAGSILRSYQTLGDLFLDFQIKGEIQDYTRSLDLERGIVTTSYLQRGSRFHREVFCSAVDQVLVVHLTSEPAGMLNFTLRINRPEDQGNATVMLKVLNPNRLRMAGQVTQHEGIDKNGGKGVRFQAMAEVSTSSGSVTPGRHRLQIRDASTATILIACSTDFYSENFNAHCELELKAARSKGFDAIKRDHIAEHQRLFNRVSLDLGKSEASFMPTDKRLAAVKEGKRDPALDALLFQFGRYLLMACSRPGSNPANLQGLWNEHIRAPWNCDYYLNINLEMNYWPAEVTNLSELHTPLFEFIERLAARGRQRARENFGCSGWVAPHATDLWAPAWTRSTQPFWGFWHHGGAWLLQHMMEHFRFTRDRVFLQKRAYPLLKGHAKFYLDWLVKDARTGKLVSGPSTSPENSYITAREHTAALCMGPAMDHQIIAELFDNVIEAAEILEITDEFTGLVKHARRQLSPGIVIGGDGRILEWDQEYGEAEKGHRHMSHLYALHPGRTIHPIKTPELAKAARKTLEYRLQHGGGGTGWSRAWLISFMARLHEGNDAWRHLQVLFERSMAPNLFDLHPPFQIDGNFGATAGIAEMLLQSHGGEIELLPALPEAWREGDLSGFCARGAFAVSMKWADGMVRQAEIESRVGGNCRVSAAGISGVRREGKDLHFKRASARSIVFETERGKFYDLIFEEPQ